MGSHTEVALRASVDPQAAASEPWDVVIVGAGPAGSAAATVVATRGLRVLLLDRENLPRPKVCGCCLSPLALSELDLLSRQSDSPLQLQIQSLRKLTIASQGHTASVPYATGGVLSRISLDTQLAEHAVRSGTSWLPDTRALHWNEEENFVSLVVQTNNEFTYQIRARRLLLAAGLHNAVRCSVNPSAKGRYHRRPQNNRIGLGVTLPAVGGSLIPQHLIMAIGNGGYCGLIRLEDNTIDVAAAIHPSVLRQSESPARALSHLLSRAFLRTDCPIDCTSLNNMPIRATPQLTHQTPPVDPGCRKLIRIGDAVGYIEPFTGEGIGWALLSARLASHAIISEAGGLRPAAQAASYYQQGYRHALSRHHYRCRLVSLALRSPRLVSTSVQVAGYFPKLTRSVARFITGNSPTG